MDHGKATAKVAIEGLIQEGESGVITAYLPDDRIFAVYFGEGRWFSFDGTSEQWFRNHFIVELNDPSLSSVF